MLEPAGYRGEFGIHPFGQHNKSVVMKQMRDSVLVVQEVLLGGVHQINTKKIKNNIL